MSSDETAGAGEACISAEDLERARRDITSRGMLLSRQDSLSLIHEIEHLKRFVGTGRALFDAQSEQVGALIAERNELRSLLVDRSPLFQDLEDAKAENARLRERVAALEGADSPTWPHVLAFARQMEAKLDQNRHKGNREGWLKDEPIDLLARLVEEVVELQHAIDRGWPSTDVAGEAADVANFALMVADAYRYRNGSSAALTQADETGGGAR